ncbi:unnamed protein product [Camellia sinensis]
MGMKSLNTYLSEVHSFHTPALMFVFAYQLADVGSTGIYTPFVKFDLHPSPRGLFLYFYGWMLLGGAGVAWQLVLLVEVGLLLLLLLVGLMLLQCCCEVVAELATAVHFLVAAAAAFPGSVLA